MFICVFSDLHVCEKIKNKYNGIDRATSFSYTFYRPIAVLLPFICPIGP